MQLSDFLGSNYEFICSGFNSGQYNMDFDRERTDTFARELEGGNPAPKAMFRLYGWKPFAVSLGFNQKAEDIDPALCTANGFDIVRRPTGGRAVLHSNELTYSVVCALPKGKSPQDLYRDIHIYLLEKLSGLGFGDEVGFEKSQPDFAALYKSVDRERSVSCFASAARWEISYHGKKLVGSAQRVFGHTLLQHGSILLGDGHERLADVIAGISDEKRLSLKAFTAGHSVTLSQICRRDITFAEAEKLFNS